MLLLGFLSLCQISFLPGYLCLRSFRLPVQGLLQTSVYSFALTLIANHTLVYALYSAGLYSTPVVYALVALEWLTLFYLMRRERFHFSVSLPSEETLDSYRALWRDRPLSGRLITIPAFAALLAGAAFCYQYFGSVYLLVDDVLSWDRWAMEWAGNRLSRTGLYPQLLPTNWSLTYVMLGNTDVKMFAKAIMPLFTLATLLLFLDLFHKTGRLTWLLGLSCYAFLLCFFFQPVFLASGYAELASAFFAFLTLYAFLQPEAGRSRPILVAVFASGTLLTKQGGVYVFALALGWLAFDFARRSDTRTWRAPALALILLVNCRWVVTGWRVTHGQESSNIAFLTRDIHEGRTYPQRWQTAWRMIERVRGLEVAPLIWLAAGVVLLSLFHPQGRLVFLLLFAPFYVLWALLFSYETRTLAMDLPFAAYCLACGAAVVAGCCLRVGRFAGSLFPQSSPPHPAYSWLRALRWLLPGGILATLILSGEAARTGVSVSHWWRSSRWLMDMGATWKWPLAAGCCLAIIAPAAANRLSPLRLRLSAPVLLLASAGAIAAVQTSVWPSEALLHDQREKRKDAGSPSLNRKLYEYARRKPLRGKILTENFYLDFLPELSRSQRYLSFPHPATPAFLEDLLADPEVNYILARVGAFPAPLQFWMSQHGFQEVFEEQGYDFFELPANRTGSGIRIFSADVRAPFGGTVSGSLQGVGFREGDRVVINGKDTYPTMFISEHELSFQVPSTLLGGPFSLELVRPEGGERTRPYRIER